MTYDMLSRALEDMEHRMMTAPDDAAWRMWAAKIDELRQVMQALLLTEEANNGDA